MSNSLFKTGDLVEIDDDGLKRMKLSAKSGYPPSMTVAKAMYLNSEKIAGEVVRVESGHIYAVDFGDFTLNMRDSWMTESI
jgi:hypothetical protein